MTSTTSTTDSASARLGGWAGIAFAVLFGVSFFMVPSPPGIDASSAEVKDYLVEHRAGSLTQLLLIALSAPLLLLCIHGLRSMISSAGQPTQLAGVGALSGGLFIAVLLAGGGAFGAGVWNESAGAAASPEVLHALWNLGYVAYQMSFPFAALFLVITGWCALRTKTLPSVLAWIGIVIGAAFAVGTLGIVVPDASVIGFVMFVALLLWVLAAGIVMVRRVPR